MESTIIRYEYRPRITFEKCGLDVERNFLQAPTCECGCGTKTNLVLNTDDDVLDFCGCMCTDNECCQCAVFAITKENKLLGAVKCGEDNIQLIQSTTNTFDLKDIGFMAEQLELHCYGLLNWKKDNLWEIVEK